MKVKMLLYYYQRVLKLKKFYTKNSVVNIYDLKIPGYCKKEVWLSNFIAAYGYISTFNMNLLILEMLILDTCLLQIF